MSLKYVLITPAWNEEARLNSLIRSVANQTLLPAAWVIVSDGSTDRTDEIVRAAATDHPWLRLLRLERSPVRHFAGKARAVNAGYDLVRSLGFDLVGNLDADITLPPDYYEFLVSRFERDPELGVAGTPYIEDDTNPSAHSYAHGAADLTHVSGACQFFRRRCFEQIGGYVPIKGGGIDWVAVTTARMKGWRTRTFLERTCLHHRAMGTADRGPLRARFRHGQEDYLVGSHPLWHTMRGVFQMKNRPFVLGGLSLILGYAHAWASRTPSPIPQDLRAFHRREQMMRLRRMCAGLVSLRRRPSVANSVVNVGSGRNKHRGLVRQ
jgi:glycosyltransferase involved in cell wall biosynthesis